MNRSKLLFAGIALSCLGFLPEARADTALQCGQRIVQVGDTAYDVSALCGVPDWVEQRLETRTISRPALVPCRVGYGFGRCTVFVQDTAQVPVEQWTYDFGPLRFIEYLTFESGRLLRVQSGPYGHKQQ